MPERALPESEGLPILTIYDRADPPSRELLAGAGQILELGARGGGRNLWAARLDEAVRLLEQPVVLVAHGIGCFAVAWWARLSPASYVERVAGAVFVEPLRSAVAATPEQRFAGPHTRLPFPSLLADNAIEAGEVARDWGSALLAGPLPALGDLMAALRAKAAALPPALRLVRPIA